MEKAGIVIKGMSEDQSALLLGIPLTGIDCVGSFLAIFFIDKMGRRYLMLRTLPLIALSWFVVATGMAFTGDDQSESNQKIGGIVACVGLSCFLLIFAA